MTRIAIILSGAALVVAAVVLSACGHGAQRSSDGIENPAASSDARVYELRGELLEIHENGTRVVIRHEEIPGYMAAMTMPFVLREPLTSGVAAVGDPVAFRFVVSNTGSWIESIRSLDAAESADLKLAEETRLHAPSDASLYQLETQWTDANGRMARLSQFRGRPVLISMVFTNCGYACPMIVSDLKSLMSTLSGDQREDVQVVLVSLDPERDTVEALHRFSQAYGLGPNWTLLRGGADDVRMLAALLGIRYREQADGQFAHTSLITLLDEGGEIVHQRKGSGTNEQLADVLLDLLADEHHS